MNTQEPIEEIILAQLLAEEKAQRDAAPDRIMVRLVACLEARGKTLSEQQLQSIRKRINQI